MKKQEHEEVSLPMVMSWATESSLRSWLLLPAGRARSESTCFRRISARTPPPIPPAAPSNPIGSRRATPQGRKRRAFYRAYGSIRGAVCRRMELAAPARARCRPASSPPAAASLLPLSLPLACCVCVGEILWRGWGEGSSRLLFFDTVPTVRLSLYGAQRIKSNSEH